MKNIKILSWLSMLVASCGSQSWIEAKKIESHVEATGEMNRNYLEDFSFLYEDPKLIIVEGGLTKFSDPRLGSIPFFDIESDRAEAVEIGDLFVSETTIKVSHWIEFIKTSGYPHYVWPSDPIDVDRDFNDNPPITQISWYEAILFCNWLSVRQGLEPVYEIEGEVNRVSSNLPKVTWITAKNGYRLATKEEWQWVIFQRMEDLPFFQTQYEKDWFIYDENGITVLSQNKLGITFPKFGALDEYVWDTKNLNDSWNTWKEPVYTPRVSESYSINGLREPITMNVFRDEKLGYSSISIIYIPNTVFTRDMSLRRAGVIFELSQPEREKYSLNRPSYYSFRVVRNAE